MILNDTKPPLGEALVHYGVPGMRWGKRKAQERTAADEYDDMVGLERQERHDRNKRIIAGSALAAVGVVATVAVLHKTGTVKINPELIAKGKEAAARVRDSSKNERVRGAEGLKTAGSAATGAAKAARDRYKDSDFAKRTFESRNTGNPLWSRTNSNVGFGQGPRSAAQHVYDGSFRVHSMNDPNIWDMPMIALTSGRK